MGWPRGTYERTLSKTQTLKLLHPGWLLLPLLLPLLVHRHIPCGPGPKALARGRALPHGREQAWLSIRLIHHGVKAAHG